MLSCPVQLLSYVQSMSTFLLLGLVCRPLMVTPVLSALQGPWQLLVCVVSSWQPFSSWQVTVCMPSVQGAVRKLSHTTLGVQLQSTSKSRVVSSVALMVSLSSSHPGKLAIMVCRLSFGMFRIV